MLRPIFELKQSNRCGRVGKTVLVLPSLTKLQRCSSGSPRDYRLQAALVLRRAAFSQGKEHGPPAPLSWEVLDAPTKCARAVSSSSRTSYVYQGEEARHARTDPCARLDIGREASPRREGRALTSCLPCHTSIGSATQAQVSRLGRLLTFAQ